MKKKADMNVRINKKSIRKKDLLFNIGFSIPGLIIYSGLMVFPIFISAYYGLHKWDGVGEMRYVGISNYVKLFTSSAFRQITSNTLILVLCSLLITVPLALITAYLIYRTTRGFKIFRAAVFMPSIVASVIIGLIFSIMLNADFGPVNVFLRSVGLEKFAKPWLSTPSTVLGAVIIPQIWQNIGYYTIIFLAAIQSIPIDLIESARIDGANSFVVFTRIVIPMITEIMEIIIILVVTGALKSFGYSWAMTQGGPVVYSSFFTVYMFRTAYVDSNFGLSSAVSLNVLVYAIGFTVLFKWLCKRISNNKM